MRLSLLMVLVFVGCSGEVAPPAETTDSAATDVARADTAVVDTSVTIDTGAATEDTNAPPLIDTGTADTGTADTGTSFDTTSFDTTSFDTSAVDFGPPMDGDIFGTGCNDVVQQGSPITQTAGVGSPPTFTGGTIVDGTYVLTKWAVYGGKAPSPTPTAETIIVTGSTWKLIADAPPYTVRGNFGVTTSGSSITTMPSCPAGGKTQTVSYTATSTELVASDPAGTDIAWFKKL